MLPKQGLWQHDINKTADVIEAKIRMPLVQQKVAAVGHHMQRTCFASRAASNVSSQSIQKATTKVLSTVHVMLEGAAL